MTPAAFDQFAANLNEALFLLSPDGVVQGVNRAAVTASGFMTQSEFLDRPLEEFVVGNVRDSYLALLHACRQTSETTIGSVWFRGQEHSQRVSGRRVKASDRPYYLLLRIEPQQLAIKEFAFLNDKIEQANREIARRKSAEEQLRLERDVAEFGRDVGVALVHSGPLGEALQRCTALMVERLDASFARIWLADQEELQLTLVASSGLYTHLDGAHSRIRFGEFKIGRIAQSQQPHISRRLVGDVQIHDQDWVAREGMVGFAGFPLVVDGATVGVMGMFTKKDLSQAAESALESVANGIALRIRKQAIEDGLASQTLALQEAHRRKDEFLAMLSHELRNPLSPVRTGLDLLALEPSQHHETIALMQDQVEHLVRLVDDLLDVSRIMRGRVELRREPVQAFGLIQQAVRTLKSSIEHAGHNLTVHMPEDSVWLDVDSVRVIQVLENLLKNACKYTNPGGEIVVSCESDQKWLNVDVRDNGIGIDADLLPHVFDLFTQSSRSLDRSEGGLGIGLTLVKQLVELHGGSVAVESAGLNQGSLFRISLPVCTAPLYQPSELSVQSQDCPPIRILAVDDNRSARLVLSRLFSKLGPHEVVTAEDGPSTLQQIRTFAPHLVLLDIGLPGMDGFEVARVIRQQPCHDGILLVALTGYGQKEDRRKSREAGFDVHLVKPPGMQQLKELLQHPKLAAAN